MFSSLVDFNLMVTASDNDRLSRGTTAAVIESVFNWIQSGEESVFGNSNSESEYSVLVNLRAHD